MALFSNGNVPPAIMDGKDFLPGHRQSDPISGIFFYNGEGDECGGLIFGSEKNEDGEFFSGRSLTFDQYKQDQLLQIVVDEQKGTQTYGINIFDRPDKPLTEMMEQQRMIESMEEGPAKQAAYEEYHKGNARRMFMGKDRQGIVAVKLSDSQGRDRIKVFIDQNDIPRLEFLDSEGNVEYSLPPQDK